MDYPYSWSDEAQAVIKDIEALVNSIHVSDALQSNEHNIYLNLVTNENCPYCIELSACGFRIVGNKHDSNDIDTEEYYDTPYSLLSKISQSYASSFGNALISKLKDLPEVQ